MDEKVRRFLDDDGRLKQLPAKQCRVRTVGGSAPFAMCKWLSDAHMPDVYLAFDFG